MYRYSVRVPQHVPRITLGVYVRRAFCLLPEHALRDAFSQRDIKMDGVRCGREEQVRPGSEVAVYTPYEARLPVAYEDAHVLALDKPAGMSCDADGYGSMTAEDWAAFYARDAFVPRLCHRLDTPTSGLLLLAKDDLAYQALVEMLARHTGDKTYECLVRGTPKPAEARLQAWWTKDALHSRVRVADRQTPESKPIETAYRVMRPGEASLLRVTLYTGRTHQIRAHMAHLGHPVLGDDLYGDRAFNRACGAGALMLRSLSIRIDTGGALPGLDGQTLSVPSRLEEKYKSILNRKRGNP